MTESDCPRVLVVTTAIDESSDCVIDVLKDRGISAIRVNTEDLPYSRAASVSLGEGEVEVSLDDSSLTCVEAVWYRRMRRGTCPHGVDPLLHDYVANETYWTLRGLLGCLSARVRWMSHPNSVDVAEQKPFQLAIARHIGLTIPRTLITSDTARIRDFVRSATSPVVGKPVRRGYVETSAGAYAIYTSRLGADDLSALGTSLPCPLILQEEQEKVVDVRVTVVGTNLYAAAIESQTDPDARTDWRRTSNPELPHAPHTLPPLVAQKCLELCGSLRLSFAAIDLVLRPDGSYVFLEVNPSGQWLWIEDRLRLPISTAVAEWLAGPQ